MSTNVFSITEFFLFTFISTSNALKAEKILKNYCAEFIMIPTLREISSSCGLSIKIAPHNLEEYQAVLQSSNVTVEEIYHVNKIEGKHVIDKLESR